MGAQTIDCSSYITDIVSLNPSFDCAKLFIAYHGKNYNKTIIEKENFENAIPSMAYCPIVCRYIREDNDIGSHDIELIKDKSNEVVLVNRTHPIGVVPENSNHHWETIVDSDGEHEYLVTDIILWKRQEAYQHIKENGIIKQSMEINVTDSENIDGYCNIKEFTFSAFCLLGSDVDPCFESACIQMYDKDAYKEEFLLMMSELKETFSKKERSVSAMKLDELLLKYNTTKEALNFDYKEMDEEELERAFAAQFKKDEELDDEEEDVAENEAKTEDPEEELEEDDESPEEEDSTEEDSPEEEDEEEEDDEEKKYTLNRVKVDELINTLLSVKVVDEYGWEYPRYVYEDVDFEAKEIYAFDREDDWKLFGFKFVEKDDAFVIDYENPVRKKFAIVDFVDGRDTEVYAVAEVVGEIYNKYLECNKDYKKLQNDISELENIRDRYNNELVGKFEAELSECEEFEAIKSSVKEYNDPDRLEEKLYALLGKYKFQLRSKPVSSPVGGSSREETSKPYGNVFDRIKK